MPNINDIVSVAEALEKSPVAIVRDKCVAVRNRNATCRKCVNACPEGAIDVCGNDITLSATLCTACGICTVVCPTESLAPLQPSDADLVKAALRSVETSGGTCAFACARIASKRQADPSSYAEVPCLSRIDESIVVFLASERASEVLFVDGDCSTCKYRANSACFDETLRCVSQLLEAHGKNAMMKRVTGFPSSMLVDNAASLHGTSRRGFFTEAIGAVRETAMTAAKTTVAQELGIMGDQEAIGNRLRVTAGGTMPQVETPRHDTVLNSLYDLGEPVADELDTHLFGSVSINADTCNSCGMCVVFCPTGALRRDAAAKPGDPPSYIEFSASSCVQCGLCEDVCWKHALHLSSTVSTSQLYDFEPIVFNLRETKRSTTQSKRQSLQ